MVALYSGCAVTELNATGSRVEVATGGDACKFLGTVTGHEGINLRSPETNIEAV